MAISEKLLAEAIAAFDKEAKRLANRRKEWASSPVGKARTLYLAQSGIDHIRTCLQHAGNNPE